MNCNFPTFAEYKQTVKGSKSGAKNNLALMKEGLNYPAPVMLLPKLENAEEETGVEAAEEGTPHSDLM